VSNRKNKKVINTCVGTPERDSKAVGADEGLLREELKSKENV
jgi:hypothetical protein